MDVGTIKNIRLSDDHHSVIATAEMAPRTEEFLVADTHLWVVRPRISGATVAGLGTLISGAYIGMEIGKSKEHKYEFVALETPPRGERRTGRPLFHSQDHRSRFAGYWHAGFLPPIASRRGGLVQVRLRRPVLRSAIFVQSPYDGYVTSLARF